MEIGGIGIGASGLMVSKIEAQPFSEASSG